MRGGQDVERSLMAGGMSAEAAAIAREAQMRSEASEAARIAYVTQARAFVVQLVRLGFRSLRAS